MHFPPTSLSAHRTATTRHVVSPVPIFSQVDLGEHQVEVGGSASAMQILSAIEAAGTGFPSHTLRRSLSSVCCACDPPTDPSAPPPPVAGYTPQLLDTTSAARRAAAPATAGGDEAHLSSVELNVAGMSCAACMSHITGPRAHQLAWLRMACRGFPRDIVFGTRHVALPPGYRVTVRGVVLHPTHQLWYYRGFYYCNSCCSIVSSLVRNLGETCTGWPSRSGKGKINRLRRGLPPTTRYQWPTGDLAREVRLVI